MAESSSVKVNVKEGLIEVSGEDPEWVAQQVDRLAALLEASSDPDPDTAADTSGSAETDEKKPRRRKKAGGGARAKAAIDAALQSKLTPEVTGKLSEWIEERHWASRNQREQAAIVAAFLAEAGIEETVSGDSIYTIYKTMGWPSPANPTATLQNAIDRDRFFTGWREGRTRLSTTGENYGRIGSKTAKPKKS